MAEPKNPGSSGGPPPAGPKKELKQDALVEHLVPDPSDVPSATLLTGFLGKSDQEGSWRLYLNPQLDEYVEFGQEDVLHTEPLPAESFPHGGTRVWLKQGTNLQHTRVASRQVQAEFLQGELRARFLPGVSAPSGIGGLAAFAAAGWTHYEFSHCAQGGCYTMGGGV